MAWCQDGLAGHVRLPDGVLVRALRALFLLDIGDKSGLEGEIGAFCQVLFSIIGRGWRIGGEGQLIKAYDGGAGTDTISSRLSTPLFARRR